MQDVIRMWDEWGGGISRLVFRKSDYIPQGQVIIIEISANP